MDKLIYLILNKKNDLDDNLNINILLKGDYINYVFVDINKKDKIYYNKNDKTIYVKDKKDKLKYSLYWIYKQKKYEYVYVINNNNIIDIIYDEIFNYKFYAGNFKKEKKIDYPIDNYIIDKKCIKILLLSIEKQITNKEISNLFRKYKIYLNKSNKNIKKINNNLILINKKNNLEFIIYTKKCGIFISKFIEKIIKSLDYNCRTVFEINNEDINNNNLRENEIYIILFPQTLKIFPQKNKYIIYQLEQVKQSKWIDDTYLNRLKDSLISWDYSIENYNNFSLEIRKKLFIFPIPILKLKNNNENNNTFMYDILFVGDLNERRKIILNFLKRKYKILIINNTHFYTDLYNEAKKCKILLNLHFYNNAILETCRINEMLMLNKIIISELPDERDYFNLELYSNYIIFTEEINNELSNINNLVSKIDLILTNNNLFKLQQNITNSINNKIFDLSSFLFLQSLKNINLLNNNKKLDYYLINNINYNKEYKYFNKIAIITSNFYNDNINYENIKNLNKYYYFDWFCFGKNNDNVNNLINFNDIIITDDNQSKKLYNIYYKIKSHNNNLFTKYSHIIWLEPDIFIKNKNFVTDIIKLLLTNEDKEYFFCKNEIYDTFEKAYNLNIKTKEKIEEQLNNYSIQFENKNFIFFNSNFFILKNNNNTKNILDSWWEEILKYDYENNLSLSFIINKMNLNYCTILKNDIINNENNQIDFKSIIDEPIVIFVISPIIESIAINFSKFFTEFDIKNRIIYDLTEEICINSKINEIFIIIHNDAIHNKLPKIYITYQVEQINSNYFTKKYYEQLDKSIVIWEYSIRNKIKYDKINLNKIFYQPMPFYYDNNIITYENNIYDIGFYGAINERRLNIMNNLSEKFKTNIGWGKIGNDRENLINNSKIILNLHYYEDSSLETCRINEILQNDKIIISELPESTDLFNKELYDDIVIYIDIINKDLSNLEVLTKKIEYYLIPENYEKQINKIKENRIKLHNKNKYLLSKNLLNINSILNFNKNKFEYELIENELYCLHLIETPYRINKFKNQEFIPKFTIFPAIKYSPGWIGTCYSYTNIIWNAKNFGLNTITVFEDDCKFKNNFYKKYKIIKKFLNKIPKWDIFVGIIANLPKDTNIINIYKYKNITFLEIDRMLSMVFNIYNKSSYDIILGWDDNNKNVHTNTIDQFLKNKNLSIITTFPFEFSCTDIDSTLWGKNLYKEYNELFKLSNDILKEKIANFSGKIIKIK